MLGTLSSFLGSIIFVAFLIVLFDLKKYQAFFGNYTWIMVVLAVLALIFFAIGRYVKAVLVLTLADLFRIKRIPLGFRRSEDATQVPVEELTEVEVCRRNARVGHWYVSRLVVVHALVCVLWALASMLVFYSVFATGGQELRLSLFLPSLFGLILLSLVLLVHDVLATCLTVLYQRHPIVALRNASDMFGLFAASLFGNALVLFVTWFAGAMVCWFFGVGMAKLGMVAAVISNPELLFWIVFFCTLSLWSGILQVIASAVFVQMFSDLLKLDTTEPAHEVRMGSHEPRA
jgi:hypothetical protein